MIIGIDCGHGLDGYPNSGAIGIISESENTRILGNKVIALLKSQGHKVVNCTVDKPSSNSDSIDQRVEKANGVKLDLFVSIHFNAGGGKGTEVMTYNKKYMVQAERILESMESIGFKNRGITNGTSPRSIAVVNKITAPSMLIETCFVDTKSDVDLYKANIDKIAEVIVEGITGQKIKSIIDNGDDDMIPSVKLSACVDSKIKDAMVQEIKGLQGCVKLPQSGIATQELCMKLPIFKGGESKGTASILQTILILKGYMSHSNDRPAIGPSCKNALEGFKKDNGIPITNELTNPITWMKLLEY